MVRYHSTFREAIRKAIQDVYHEDQALGQPVGRFDIRCTYKAQCSKWVTSSPSGDAPVPGLLHFNLAYKESGSVPLRSATVQIDVRRPVAEGETPIIELCAPASSITGCPQMQHIQEVRTTDPQFEATAGAFAGLRGSGRSHQINTEFDEEHRWTFKASPSSDNQTTRVTRGDFIWTRTLRRDQTGLDRSYDGALFVHGDVAKKFILKVTVEVQPWNWYHRVVPTSRRTRNSEAIGPRPGESVSEEDFGIRTREFAKLQSGIETQIKLANDALAPTQLANFQQLSLAGDDEETTREVLAP